MNDSELRKKLLEFNVKVGPITETTRQLYQRKLESLQNPQTKSTPRATPANRPKSPARLPQAASIPGATVKPKPATPVTIPKPSTPIEPVEVKTFEEPTFVRKPRSSTHYYVNSDSDDGDMEYFQPKRNTSTPNSNTSLNTPTRNRYSWLQNWWLVSGSRQDRLSKPKIPTSTRSQSFSPCMSSGSNNRFSKLTEVSDQSDNDTSYVSRNEVGIGTSPHMVMNRLPYEDENLSRISGPSTPFKSSYKNLKRQSFVSTTSIPWQWIFVVLFLVLSGYLVHHELNDPYGKLLHNFAFSQLICAPEVKNGQNSSLSSGNCIRDVLVPEVKRQIGRLFEIISRASGDHKCSEGSSKFQIPLPIQEAKKMLEQNDDGLSLKDEKKSEEVWQSLLLLLLKLGPEQFMISCYDKDKQLINPENSHNLSIEAVHFLESTRPYFTGRCRFWVFWRSLLDWAMFCFRVSAYLAVFICIAYALYRLIMHRRAENERVQNLIHEMVSHVLNLLQNQMRESELDIRVAPWKTVKDILMELRTRYSSNAASGGHKSRQMVDKLWPEVAHYILNNESCVVVEDQLGIGETWCWQGGSGWQGSALHNDSISRKAPFSIPPTECLKIRNMCINEGLDEVRKNRVKRELFRKISHCGNILHIAVSTVSDQPIVYVCSDSPDVAGRVFHTINANYFDGRLVTARFLKYDKYCQRFPEMRNISRALRESDFYEY